MKQATDRKAIYKILKAAEWEKAKGTSAYAGSPDDLRDGFIHFSTAEQLQGTIDKYYCGEKNARILAFDPALFADTDLKWEKSRGGALFPHLYATLNIAKADQSWTVNIPAEGNLDLSFLKEQ